MAKAKAAAKAKAKAKVNRRKTQPRNKRKPSRKTKRPNLFKKELLRIVLGLSILLVLVVVAGTVAHYFLMRDPVTASLPPSTTYPITPDAHLSKPRFEVFPKEMVPPPAPDPIPLPLPLSEAPKVAIIIDDLGYDRRLAEQFIHLKAALTFSVLPKAPFTETLARMAHKNGHEVMLHQPMEPAEYPNTNPGPGTLFRQMEPDQLIRMLNENLDEVPYVRGVNNHMGSALTTSSPQLRQIFTVLKKRRLYFIDSRTTAESQARASASLLKIPYAERDIFIDHFQDPEFIRNQLEALIQQAEKYGRAVGIGHPHPITLEVLEESLPVLQEKVEIVPASQVVAEMG